MDFDELDGNERRHFINIQQIYSAWARARLEKARHGGLHWKTAPSGQDYLYQTKGKIQKSLGPRSPELEAVYAAHHQRTADLTDRITNLDVQLHRFAPVNKAYRLARVPIPAARVLRRLAEALGTTRDVITVGTNALYAYEAKTGLRLSGSLTSTEDLDLLWNAKRRLSLVLPGEAEQGTGIFRLLKSVDRSYERIAPFRAENRDGYIVDIIRPERRAEVFRAAPKLSDDADELEPSAIQGLQWLANAPRMQEIAVAADGLPVPITAPDPRAFALHKLWLSEQPNRNPLKKSRDAAQAGVAAIIATRWLNLRFDDNALTALPSDLLAGVPQLMEMHA